mmetsp:Transcript_910/g.1045  ORF Transcript_910/g.1045 Transcript_910/m.1045 type:complete len:148 (-) Transcript_910:34-477(-)
MNCQNYQSTSTSLQICHVAHHYSLIVKFQFQSYSHCMETAQYLRTELTQAGFTARLNDLSSTVVLERPMDDAFIKRWQLACEEDIAHVVVMPNITRSKIDQFVKELIECRDEFGRMSAARDDSPLNKLACSSWGGNVVAPVGDFKSE